MHKAMVWHMTSAKETGEFIVAPVYKIPISLNQSLTHLVLTVEVPGVLPLPWCELPEKVPNSGRTCLYLLVSNLWVLVSIVLSVGSPSLSGLSL